VCLYIIIEGENIVKELPPSVKSEHLVDSSSGHAPYPLDNFDPPKAERVNIKKENFTLKISPTCLAFFRE
jgi:hypothetical protein